MKQGKVQVFAIVRIDKYISNLESQIAVQAVFPSIAEARAEVERLNSLVDADKMSYSVYATRYYPNGRQLSDDD